MRLIRNLIGLFTLIASVLQAQQAIAQPDHRNNLAITSSLLLHTFNSAQDLEQPRIINNAIRLALESSRSQASVYVRVSSMYGTSGTPMPPSNLKLELSATTASGSWLSNVNYNDIPLSFTDQLLFVQGRRNNSVYYYDYNLKLGPIGYDTPPGWYFYTILFTMTQP